MAKASASLPPKTGFPALRKVPPGLWWRIHSFDAASGQHAPQAFNGSGLGNARFSPLHGPAGVIIPTLYAAGSLDGALMETVLHDVPYPSDGHIHDIDRSLRGTLHASSIEITVALDLVDLTKIGLQRIGLRVSEVFETEAHDYPRTRAWAHTLRDALPAAQGLYWMSSRQPECPAMVLFGDRVPAHAVQPGPTPSMPLSNAKVYASLLALLQRLGCGVSPNR